jgi:hypothetical protein
MKSRHYFTPKDGNLNFENRSGFQNRIKLLKEVRHVMTIKEDKETRSDKQRKYQFGVVYKLLAEHTGYTIKEIHQEMGKEFLLYEHLGTMFVKSTADLNTKEMEEYLENVRRLGSAELGCYIPLPNESDLPYDI